MNSELKNRIMNAINEMVEENKNKPENVMVLFNLYKIIKNFEELEPDIQTMLNKKAQKDKWQTREEEK